MDGWGDVNKNFFVLESNPFVTLNCDGNNRSEAFQK
jgi:hypothetical protein